MNWFWTLIVGAFTPTILKNINGYTFLIFGVFSLLAAIFCMIFMKETKGLTDDQLSKVYYRPKDVLGDFERKEALRGDKALDGENWKG